MALKHKRTVIIIGLIGILFIGCICLSNSNSSFIHEYNIFNSNNNLFDNVAKSILEYENDLYIDKENLAGVKDALNIDYQIVLPSEDILKIFDKGYKYIMKEGNAVFFYRKNIHKKYGIRACGIVYFQYYYSTNESRYELVTMINALQEKDHHWYYYEQR